MNEVHIVHPLDKDQTKQFSMTDGELTTLIGAPNQRCAGNLMVHPGISNIQQLAGATIINTRSVEDWLGVVRWITDEREGCR